MNKNKGLITRRHFLRGAACAGLAMAIDFPSASMAGKGNGPKTRVVLVRDEQALNENGKANGQVIQEMLDSAVKALLDEQDVVSAWKELVRPSDTVGIKSNVWYQLPTPRELEQAIYRRVSEAGVLSQRIAIDDRGVLSNPIFQNSTALINVRPVRTHFWSGIGGCMKNYIMFVPTPSSYHRNSCEDLAAIWKLPVVKDKTKLNVLCVLQPLFHGRGPHHFSRKYLWEYKGLLVGTDPVAVDTMGLRLIMAKRLAYFGEEKKLGTLPLHVEAADTKHNLGTSDLNRIELIKLGWEEDVLI
ncbi:MAG: DUF362 domain-containing protein [Deltaproteobacteria bacterium]|nr:MAG: DUF362 domain-containing protein [Deltaproteobacteria bacterium]